MLPVLVGLAYLTWNRVYFIFSEIHGKLLSERTNQLHLDLCIMITGTDKDLVRPVLSYIEQYI